MTTRLTAHFDGKVIVPDEPVDLPANQRLTLHVETDASGQIPQGVSGEEMIKLIRELHFDPNDVAEMTRAIEEGCERIDPDGW